MLRKYGVAPQNIGGLERLTSDFDKSIENMTDVAPAVPKLAI